MLLLLLLARHRRCCLVACLALRLRQVRARFRCSPLLLDAVFCRCSLTLADFVGFAVSETVTGLASMASMAGPGAADLVSKSLLSVTVAGMGGSGGGGGAAGTLSVSVAASGEASVVVSGSGAAGDAKNADGLASVLEGKEGKASGDDAAAGGLVSSHGAEAKAKEKQPAPPQTEEDLFTVGAVLPGCLLAGWLACFIAPAPLTVPSERIGSEHDSRVVHRVACLHQ